jgi:prepilin-type N-terminal cleavage/methylation domain-containing protein
MSIGLEKSKFNKSLGFTLVELLVVIAIVGFLSTTLIINFSRTRIDLNQSVNIVISTIRNAEDKAIASTIFNGYHPCGYGIHYINSNEYAIYVGPSAAIQNCSLLNKNYNPNKFTLLKSEKFNDTRVSFIAPFSDVFFEPPDPKTYINDDSSLNQPPLNIIIGKGSCPDNCQNIYVYPSGKIETH